MLGPAGGVSRILTTHANAHPQARAHSKSKRLFQWRAGLELVCESWSSENPFERQTLFLDERRRLRSHLPVGMLSNRVLLRRLPRCLVQSAPAAPGGLVHYSPVQTGQPTRDSGMQRRQVFTGGCSETAAWPLQRETGSPLPSAALRDVTPPTPPMPSLSGSLTFK